MLRFDHPCHPRPFSFLNEEQFPNLPSVAIYQQAISRIDTAFSLPSGSYFFEHLHSQALTHLLLAHLATTSSQQILTSASKLPAHRLALDWAERFGARVSIIPNDQQGRINLSSLEELISKETSLISLSIGNSLTSLLQPFDSLATLCEKHSIPLHLDISTVGSHISLPKCSYITCCGSDLHGPPSALIWVCEQYPLPLPFHLTGELNLETLHLFSLAAEEHYKLKQHYLTELIYLRNFLLEKLLPTNPLLYNPPPPTLGHVLCIAWPGVDQDALCTYLRQQGVWITTGGGRQLPLSSLDIPNSHLAVSLSLTHKTKETDIEQAAKIICAAVEAIRLRRGSL